MASDPTTNDREGATPKPGKRRVVVVGYGPVGRAVADEILKTQVDVTIVELNLETVARQLTLEKNIVFGSLSDPATLEAAGVETADAVVLAIPDEEEVLRACEQVRKVRPDVFIAARANYVSRGLAAKQAGADEVVIEEIVTAQAMRDVVMQKLAAKFDR